MISLKLQEQKDIFEQHIFDSYFNLRIGIAVLAILSPLVLLIGGYVMEGEIRSSISDYYYLESMRDVFVGSLCAIGVFLFLYKGWEHNKDVWLNENRALNFAGWFSIGVAMFPTQTEPKPISIHGICAVMLFVCMAYVCIARAPDTLEQLDSETLRNKFQKSYKKIGGLMLAVPAIAYSFVVAFDRLQNYTFFVETFGIWVFAYYWLKKSSELSLSGIERKAPVVTLSPMETTDDPRVIHVDPGLLNYPTGIKVEMGQRYQLKAKGMWLDWFIPTDPKGWGRWCPLKRFNRKRGKPFFMLCGNVGKIVDDDVLSFCIDEGHYEKETQEYICTWTIPELVKDGSPLEDHQLYLFANDIASAYGNNRTLPGKRGGPMAVTITRLG